MKMGKFGFNVGIIIFSVSVLLGCKKDDNADDQPDTGTKVGQMAPLFEMTDSNSNVIKLADYRGKLVLIDFWASWCSFCRAESPELRELYNSYNSKGLEIIGISLDTDIQDWMNAINSDGLNYINIIETDAFDSQVAIDYGIKSIPTMFLIDKEGIIIAVTSDAAQLETKIANRLN